MPTAKELFIRLRQYEEDSKRRQEEEKRRLEDLRRRRDEEESIRCERENRRRMEKKAREERMFFQRMNVIDEMNGLCTVVHGVIHDKADSAKLVFNDHDGQRDVVKVSVVYNDRYEKAVALDVNGYIARTKIEVQSALAKATLNPRHEDDNRVYSYSCESCHGCEGGC